MAIFSLEIADVDVERVLTAVANNYGWLAIVSNPAYQLTEEEQPNPEYDPEDPDSGPETIMVVIEPVDENGDPIPLEIDNPETSGDFTHRMVRGFLEGHVKKYERGIARAQALHGLDVNVDISDPEV
jgi:hypothetical protein